MYNKNLRAMPPSAIRGRVALSPNRDLEKVRLRFLIKSYTSTSAVTTTTITQLPNGITPQDADHAGVDRGDLSVKLSLLSIKKYVGHGGALGFNLISEDTTLSEDNRYYVDGVSSVVATLSTPTSNGGSIILCSLFENAGLTNLLAGEDNVMVFNGVSGSELTIDGTFVVQLVFVNGAWNVEFLTTESDYVFTPALSKSKQIKKEGK
jgi:hypothetical protein